MRKASWIVCGLLLGCDSVPPDPLEQRFATSTRPFFEQYCFSCHNDKKHKGDLNLAAEFSVDGIAKNPKVWDLVRSRLQAKEMPPEEAPKQPKEGERHEALAWLRDLDDREATRNAGDPGPVLARRLSNAEYDYTIRDLTGVDIRPTREFPVDPANESGFDNSGESLTMSEALLKKYLAAARHVADHLVLKPQGFVFAPHPVVTDTDRDKYCVERIVSFYKRHEVDLAAYFAALQGKPKAGLSAKYLTAIRGLLEGGDPDAAATSLRELWRKGASPAELAAAVARLREKVPVTVEPLQVKGMSRGSQPILLWRNEQIAALHRKGGAFAAVFPDVFVVLERGPYYDKGSSPKGRYLSAGFHLMQGYHRDDGPLYDLVLDAGEQRVIDGLWRDLHFICNDALRQYKDFIFFERAEPPRFMYEAAFDFARSEDKDSVSEPKIRQLREAYLEKAKRIGASDNILTAIAAYFESMNAQLRQVEQERLAAEPAQLKALLDFAARAYRRRLDDAERDGLLAFYRRLRDTDQLSHEDALRDTVAAVLMSPHFSYRFMPSKGGALTNEELASRLSYFLWSSMPDAELLAADLRNPDILVAQAKRMLRDPKVRGLATEFAGNWLDFRRFEEHNAVDRDRFPGFTNELRQAMFEEPVRYFMEIVRKDRPLLDLIYGNDVVVNRVLAKHYGIPELQEDWATVEDARPYGRGGLLTMAVFLTKNAPGLRTSPVKRGYWVVRRLLGEIIPPPPPTVPALPKDEAALGDLTLPQVLVKHREDRACAGCHNRFDSYGLAFEGYGPIGERRTVDLGGKPVQDGAGVAGVLEIVRTKREPEFVDNLCRKLLSYALSRSLLPSDRGTLEAMRAKGDRFGGLVEVIVTSPQFLNKRASP